MTSFTLHTPETAPEKSQPLLQNSLNAFGMIPNLHAVMALSPELLEGYQVLHGLFLNSSLTDEEKTVVWQSINVEHNCHYCVPAHTGIAKSMQVSDEVNNALRDQTPLPTTKLEALRTYTLAMVKQRGALSDDQTQQFLQAGYTQQNILEIVLALSQKVMSNYTNHLAETPLDAPFKAFDWTKS